MIRPPDAGIRTPPPLAAAARGTRVWTLESAEGTADVEVEAADSATLSEVLAALPADLGLGSPALWVGSTPMPPSTPLSVAALRHGAVLGLGRPGPRTGPDGAAPASSGALELHVVGGPDAGRAMPLGQGELVLGRSAAGDFCLTDPDVSRRHVLVSVGTGEVTVADLGSSNGTRLRTPTGTSPLGERPSRWPVGSTLLLGASAVRLTGPRGAPLDCTAAPAGRVGVRPVSAAPALPPPVTVRVPSAPVDAARRRLSWIAIALPAVGGLLMAWLLGTPQFLFFALLSPAVAVGTWLSDRVTARRDRRRTRAASAMAWVQFEDQLASAVSAAATALDEAHPDPAHLTAAVRRRSSPLWARTRNSADLLVVRLGTGPGPAPVTRMEADGTRAAVIADHLPVTLDLAAIGSMGIVGPRAPAFGVVRSLLLQLAALAPPGELAIVVATTPDRLQQWRWTRWLPGVTTTVHAPASPGGSAADDGPLMEALAAAVGAGGRTLAVLDTPVGPRAAQALRGEGLVSVALGATESSLAVGTTACLTVRGETGARGALRLSGSPTERDLTLDTVPEPVAASTARSLAALAPPAGVGGLPDTAALLDVPSSGLRLDPGTGDSIGRWPRDRGSLRCVPGYAEQGPLTLDLCAQGPHVLVAGTTGSGKSELLQTLVAGLALHHPPDLVSFLLVDYKGGAAFAEAARLPHTVGMLTDLDPQSTVRALRSLTAELTRRERLLAGQGARDVAELPPEIPLARLVIVVDEFATLAEELPSFVSGLVGIAQRGRSLGVHLVLATQRPAGVVSPEIRANCSLRICLRTTDESDSRDVLGSSLAASLPMSRPGRACLRAGNSPPMLIQVARVAGTSLPSRSGVAVRRYPWPPVTGPAGRSATDQGASDLARLVAALRRRAGQEELTPPTRPWLPPLPDHLPAEDLDRTPAGEAMPPQLRIGLLDSPDTQSQEPLVVDLTTGGGWLAVGGPRSGRTTVLRTVLGEAVHHLTPEQLQVYVLDHGGGALATEADRWAHTGTAVGRDEAHRTVRLLARLQAEVDHRRAENSAEQPFLLLLVDGYESVAAQLDDADPGTGSAALLRLVRDGAAAGLTCVVTAERAVPGSRVAASMATRLVLPLPDRADYAVAGIGPRSVPSCRPPGRALVGEDAAECQIVLPRTAAPPADRRARAHRRGPAPIRVVPLPADPHMDLTEGDGGEPGESLWLWIGPGGDDGRPVGLDLLRSGGLLVVGPPGSGRTSSLTAFGQHCRNAGMPILHLVTPTRPSSVRSSEASDQEERTVSDGPPGDRVSVTDAPALQAWVAASAGRPAVVVADEVTALPEPIADVLSAGCGPGGGLIVLAAASAADLAGTFRGPTVALRRNRTALLLRPAPGDAELLGLRVPRAPLPARPGAGWLLVDGSVTRVQVARHRGPAGHARGRP